MIASYLVLFVALAAVQVVMVLKLADSLDDDRSVDCGRPAHAGQFVSLA